MKYSDLPHLDPGTLPTVEYGEIANLKRPLCRAVNSARLQNESKMDDIVATLEFLLYHIKGAPNEAVEEVADAPVSNDPLDELLGPASSNEGDQT